MEEIAYDASRYNIRLVPCPVRHLGTEYAGSVLAAMHDYLATQTHTTFAELTTATDILVENRPGQSAFVSSPRKGESWEARSSHVIAAPGRGGAEWLANEAEKLGLRTQNNEVDIGVRVEVPNAIMDHLTKYLYEAKLIYYSDTYENKVRTFCMNPGGVVSEEHYESGLAVVNGHSYGDPARRTGNTNFALLVSTRLHRALQSAHRVRPVHRPAGAICSPADPIMVQRLGDLLQGRRTSWERLAKSTTIPTLQTAVPG